jgi:large conductance mechanosensitive channel
MLKEFKEFAMKGNVMDMAVGIIIGGAFGKIITSLVNDVIMPPIGLVMGKVDFSKLAFQLQAGVAEVKDAAGEVVTEAIAPVSINYGAFINNVLDFVIVAFCIFMVIKGMNKAKRQEAEAPAEPAAPPAQEVLLAEIRDLLAK